jgi:hypothetical protein
LPPSFQKRLDFYDRWKSELGIAKCGWNGPIFGDQRLLRKVFDRKSYSFAELPSATLRKTVFLLGFYPSKILPYFLLAILSLVKHRKPATQQSEASLTRLRYWFQ